AIGPGTLIRAEPGDDGRDFLRPARYRPHGMRSAQRTAEFARKAPKLLISRRGALRRIEGTRTDGVAAHAVASHLAGDGPGETNHALLRRRIAAKVCLAGAGFRTGVHNNARLLGDHVRYGGPRHGEGPLQIDCDHRVPVLFGHEPDGGDPSKPRVVDQDVEALIPSNGGLYDALGAFNAGYAGVCSDRIPAGPSNLLR